MILLKKWKILLFLIITVGIGGSVYYLYKHNISLTLDLQQTELALKARELDVKRLEEDRIRIDRINAENTIKRNQITANLKKYQQELNRLKMEAISNGEKGSECLNVPIPDSINKRLRDHPR